MSNGDNNSKQANHLLSVPPDYLPLPVPVPPFLEEAFGYHSAISDFVSFFEGPGGELYWDDGRTFTNTTNWQAYMAFITHPKVWPHLIDQRATNAIRAYWINKGLNPPKVAVKYKLGSDEETPRLYRLILDRRIRKIFIVPEKDAYSIINRQWTENAEIPRLPTEQELAEAQLHYEDWLNRLETSQDQPEVSQEEMLEYLKIESQWCDQLVAWLDNYHEH